MKKIITKNITTIAMIFALALTALTPFATSAATLNLGLTDYAAETGLGNTDPRDMAINILNVLMTFLGLIAVIVILLGGFKWMTAGGNEDKVGEAKKLLAAGVVGLIIILASYGIATFVINQMIGVTNQGGGNAI